MHGALMKFTLPKSNSYRLVLSFIGLAFFLFQFNNCSQVNSQMGNVNDNSSTRSVLENTPVDSSNPLVVMCISSSDGNKIAPTLRKLINPNTGSQKLTGFDWDQKDDLIATIDNTCLIENNYQDPIIPYIDLSQISNKTSKSIHIIKKDSITQLESFLKTAQESECLLAAEKNLTIKVSAINEGPDTFFNSQVHLQASSQNAVAINATPSTLNSILTFVDDPNFTSNNKVVKIAVIDTGIDTINPDLAPILARDVTGAVIGANTTDLPSQGFLTDSGYHGTHVAGLIAAQYNNSMGVSGVYGRNVIVYPLRVSKDGNSMTIASIAQALQKAVEYKVDIVNLSLSTETDSTLFRNAINDTLAAGISIIVAAGNGDADTGAGGVLGSTLTSYPAMYSTATNGLITVGSLDLTTLNISSFSNRSPNYVDLLAPGSNAGLGILSTIPLNVNISQNQTQGPGYGSSIVYSDGTFDLIHGTSMATPQVAGAVASAISMAKSRGKSLSHTQIKSWLRGDASPKNSGFSNFSYSGSYLNLQNLYTYVSSNISALPNISASTNTIITIATQPTSKQAVAGESLSLTVTASATNNSPLSYQWYKDSFPITGATSSQLVLNNLRTDQAGLYKVVLGTSNGETLVSTEISVKVALNYCN